MNHERRRSTKACTPVTMSATWQLGFAGGATFPREAGGLGAGTSLADSGIRHHPILHRFFGQDLAVGPWCIVTYCHIVFRFFNLIFLDSGQSAYQPVQGENKQHIMARTVTHLQV